jgi:hypothetical protein
MSDPHSQPGAGTRRRGDPRMTLDETTRNLLGRMQVEALTRPSFQLRLDLDLTATMVIVGNLQLALRHPANVGHSHSARLVRKLIADLIAGMRERGYVASAEACELGDDPAYDETSEARS